MRVMQLTTDLRFGGAERVIANLVHCLSRRGVCCAVAGLEAPGDDRELRRRLREAGCEVHCADLHQGGRARKLTALRAHLARWKPDVLHCHLFHGHLAGALMRLTGLDVPMVWTHHSIERRRLPLRAVFYRLAGPLAGWHTFPSRAAQRYQRRRQGGLGRQQVVPNGIDLAPYEALTPEPGSVVGAVGRLVPEKGFDALVRALGRRASRRAELRLRIGGRGPARRSLEDLARSCGVADRVEFVGFVREVPRFLERVNVFAVPSRWESFGLVLLEALAGGLPCVASPVGALPELGGDHVRWAAPGDPADLAAALTSFGPEAWASEQVEARRKAVSRFSRRRMAEEFLRIYRRLLR